MVRTFIAVELSADVKKLAAQLIGDLSDTGARVRWAEPDQLHLTLKFLGEVRVNQVAQLCRVMGGVADGRKPIALECGGFGAFPDLQRPRTLWMGVSDSQPLMELHEQLESAFADLGFRRERRRFRPHVTLGRVKGQQDERQSHLAALAEQVAAANRDVSVRHTARELVLFSSELQRDGPIYSPLGRVSFR